MKKQHQVLRREENKQYDAWQSLESGLPLNSVTWTIYLFHFDGWME